ncbi:MAG: hypothetical protein ACREVK_13490 [Gammaproteobacteria bacterium]
MSYQELEADEKSTTNYLAVFVKAVGIIVLLVGVWIGVKVMSEAWALYQAPHHIERFANAVEHGSNLDKVLSIKAAGIGAEHNIPGKTGMTGYEETERPVFKLSYFAAWGIVIMLLLLIGRLAMIAIKTGGELALYDRQVRHVAKVEKPSSDRSAHRGMNEPKERLRRS